MFAVAISCLHKVPRQRPLIDDVLASFAACIQDCKKIASDPVLADLTQQMDECGLELVQLRILCLLQTKDTKALNKCLHEETHTNHAMGDTFIPLHRRPCGFLLQYCFAYLERLPLGDEADLLWKVLMPSAQMYFEEQVRRVRYEQKNIQVCIDQLAKDSGHEGMYKEVMAEEHAKAEHKDYVLSFKELEDTVGTTAVLQTTKDMFQIYKQGEAIQPTYNKFIKELADAVGSEFVKAPLKKLYRSVEKIGVRPRDKNRWDGRTLTDVVRGTVVIPYSKWGAGAQFLQYVLLCAHTLGLHCLSAYRSVKSEARLPKPFSC